MPNWVLSLSLLRISMHYRKLSNKDWEQIEERIKNKLSSWKEKYLSVEGRLVLVNYVLSSLPIFIISFFEVPKGFLKKVIISSLDSSDCTIARRKGIDLLNGDHVQTKRPRGFRDSKFRNSKWMSFDQVVV
jgi:hypothetical protein